LAKGQEIALDELMNELDELMNELDELMNEVEEIGHLKHSSPCSAS
jgi:hypothetical protein